MDITWGQLGNELLGQAKKRRVPISGNFELTSRCNLRCKMCYVSSPVNDKNCISRERTTKEWIHLAEEARDSGMLYLLLTGGEVFVRKDFKEIYEELSKMGFNIQIYSNATMITPEIASWLGRIPPSKFSVTLYGSSPEVYERICGYSDGFNRAIRGIDLLLAEGINLKLKTTVIKGNVNEFNKLTELAEKRGVEFSIVNYITPRREGSGTCPEVERLCPKDLANYEIYAENYFTKRALNTKNIKDKNKYTIEDTPERNPNKSDLTEINTDAFNCTAGKCSFWVTWDGRMSPCGLMDNPVVFPFENGFATSWSKLNELCSYIPSCTECKQCSIKDYCMPCPARLKSETGTYDKPAQYLCELAQIRKELRHSLHK
jgi:radical SAM protein with 4Fe4S-binding SPASM domain